MLGLIVCALVGVLYGYLWQRSIVYGGLWDLLYFEACVVSVYLPTQGLSSAWGYRFLYLAVPSVLVWRWAVGPLRANKGWTIS